ncbi:hypothetical protein PVAND_013662 [Polypedilum vanderplanki]|uniref:Cuticular protein n=1 Tax=Polypedilum vanderplanki TaxID=319348 RepID=A0A9J6CRB9_POLVA|nr:hypothetical protein PVAND_013662 [Polypedilum vanderplanki]
MILYLWSVFIASLLFHLSIAAPVDSKASPSNDRQTRQAIYRGNQKFQMPEYLKYGLTPDHYSRTVYSTEHRDIDGSFNYEYQTDNGIRVKQDSTGYGPNKVVRGYYSYIGADGKQYTVNYIADRFGYRAFGEHLPTQPNYLYDVNHLPSHAAHFPARPAPSNLLDEQHHTQTAFYPAETLQSKPILVTEAPTTNFVNITPKPFVHSNINFLPQASYVHAPPYNQIAWTTARPLVSF